MKPLNFTRIVFIDRSFGGHRLAALLERVGFDVKVHGKWFKDDEDDHIWIPDVASRGWVIFTSDKRISKDPLNVRSVLDSKAQVIMSSDNNTLPEFWGAAFITGRIKLNELLDSNPGPGYIQISGNAKDHIKLVKLYRTHANEKQGSETPSEAGANIPEDSEGNVI